MPGLYDAPRSGQPSKITLAYQDKWLESVRLRPRALGLDFSLWTLARLSDYLAEANWGEKSWRNILKPIIRKSRGLIAGDGSE